MEQTSNKQRFDGTQLIITSGDGDDCYDAGYLISLLLVCVAKGDGEIASSESEKMIELLSSRLDIRNSEAMERLSRAVMELANDNGILERLRDISKSLSTQEKSEVLSMMLDVAMADGQLDKNESNVMSFASRILGISQNEMHTALRARNSG